MDSNTVNVVGWYGKSNIGDESYKLAFPKIFPSYNFIFSDWPIKNADAYILGGGDVINEKLLSKFHSINKPKHIMSVTVSKKHDPEKLKDFRTIIVRDLKSKTNLSEIGINCIVCPDFSFILEGNKENGKSIIEENFSHSKSDLYNKKVAIIINGHLIPPHGATAYEQSRFDRFCFDLSITIDETPASFIFIPFGTKQPWDDRVANGMVSVKCKWWKKNCLVYKELEVQDSLDIIAASDAVVSTRLHASIFSCATETPFIDITHNHKNKYFLETINYEKASVGYEDFKISKTKSLIKKSISNNDLKEEIGSMVSMYKLLLKEIDKSIIIT